MQIEFVHSPEGARRKGKGKRDGKAAAAAARARERILRSVRAGSRDEPRGGDFRFAADSLARTHANAHLSAQHAVKPRKTPIQSLRAFSRHNPPQNVPRAPTPVFECLAANGQIGGRRNASAGTVPNHETSHSSHPSHLSHPSHGGEWSCAPPPPPGFCARAARILASPIW